MRLRAAIAVLIVALLASAAAWASTSKVEGSPHTYYSKNDPELKRISDRLERRGCTEDLKIFGKKKVRTIRGLGTVKEALRDNRRSQDVKAAKGAKHCATYWITLDGYYAVVDAKKLPVVNGYRRLTDPFPVTADRSAGYLVAVMKPGKHFKKK